MSSSPSSTSDMSVYDVDQFSLPVTLLIPVAAMIGFIAIVHLILLRTHTAFRDTVKSSSSSPNNNSNNNKLESDTSSIDNNNIDMSNPLILADQFIQRYPPKSMLPEFQTNLNLIWTGISPRLLSDNLTIDQKTKEFIVKFRNGFHACMLTHPCSYHISIVSRDIPSIVVAMGFSRFPYPENRLPGWHKGSIGFHTNLRKYVDKGGYVGESFPIVSSDDISIPKKQANTYTITYNHQANEIYLSQGIGTYRFHRVLAQSHELRLQDHPYYPTIGANGRCTVHITPFIPSDDEINLARQNAWASERQFTSSTNTSTPGTTTIHHSKSNTSIRQRGGSNNSYQHLPHNNNHINVSNNTLVGHHQVSNATLTSLN